MVHIFFFRFQIHFERALYTFGDRAFAILHHTILKEILSSNFKF